MNVQALFDALGGIDDRFLAEAEALRPVPHKKRWLRAALIAAVLAGLFSVTAYAAGWFGLRARVTAAQDLSLSGMLDSGEAQAFSEWTEYRDAYADAFLASRNGEPFELSWTEESPTLRGAAALYGALDRESAEKLLEIAARHGLSIHSDALRFSSSENFFRAAGVPAFAGTAADYRGLVYEDGSYKAELRVPIGDGEERFSLERHFTGKLQPTGLERALVRPEDFLEWPYQNTHGQTLSLALSSRDEHLFAIGRDRVSSEDDRQFPFYIFYFQEGQYLTAVGSLRLSRLHGFDKAAARTRLEAVADSVDFAAAAAADCDTAFFLNYMPVSSPAQGKPDLAAFLARPEARATLAMQRELSARCGLEIGRGMESAVLGGGDLDLLRNGDPIPGSVIDTLLEEQAERYGLRAPREGWTFRGGSRIPLTNTQLPSEGGPVAISYNLSGEEILALAGQGDFGGEIRSLLDNGAFWGFDTELCEYLYLPRGSFLAASLLYAAPVAAESPGWFYQNANGDTVWLCRTEGDPKVGYLLYESEGGWFLLLVNGPELWQLEEAADRLRLSELN